MNLLLYTTVSQILPTDYFYIQRGDSDNYKATLSQLQAGLEPTIQIPSQTVMGRTAPGLGEYSAISLAGDLEFDVNGNLATSLTYLHNLPANSLLGNFGGSIAPNPASITIGNGFLLNNNQLNINPNLILQSLVVQNIMDVTASQLNLNTINVTGTASFAGATAFNGNLTFNSLATMTQGLTVVGTTTLEGSVNVTGNLYVNGVDIVTGVIVSGGGGENSSGGNSSNSTITSSTITSSFIDSSIIGGNIAAAGTFTNLSASTLTITGSAGAALVRATPAATAGSEALISLGVAHIAGAGNVVGGFAVLDANSFIPSGNINFGTTAGTVASGLTLQTLSTTVAGYNNSITAANTNITTESNRAIAAETALTGTITAETTNRVAAINVLTTNLAAETAARVAALAAVSQGLIYQGMWNPLTNSPALVSGVGTTGYAYVTSVANGTTILDGTTFSSAGVIVVFNGTKWVGLNYGGLVALLSSPIFISSIGLGSSYKLIESSGVPYRANINAMGVVTKLIDLDGSEHNRGVTDTAAKITKTYYPNLSYRYMIVNSCGVILSTTGIDMSASNNGVSAKFAQRTISNIPTLPYRFLEINSCGVILSYVNSDGSTAFTGTTFTAAGISTQPIPGSNYITINSCGVIISQTTLQKTYYSAEEIAARDAAALTQSKLVKANKNITAQRPVANYNGMFWIGESELAGNQAAWNNGTLVQPLDVQMLGRSVRPYNVTSGNNFIPQLNTALGDTVAGFQPAVSANQAGETPSSNTGTTVAIQGGFSGIAGGVFAPKGNTFTITNGTGNMVQLIDGELVTTPVGGVGQPVLNLTLVLSPGMFINFFDPTFVETGVKGTFNTVNNSTFLIASVTYNATTNVNTITIGGGVVFLAAGTVPSSTTTNLNIYIVNNTTMVGEETCLNTAIAWRNLQLNARYATIATDNRQLVVTNSGIGSMSIEEQQKSANFSYNRSISAAQYINTLAATAGKTSCAVVIYEGTGGNDHSTYGNTEQLELVFSAALVTGNSYSATFIIDGVNYVIPPVVFATTSDAMMQAIATIIAGTIGGMCTATVSTVLAGSTSNARIITVLSSAYGIGTISVTNSIVVGGASQATTASTIIQSFAELQLALMTNQQTDLMAVFGQTNRPLALVSQVSGGEGTDFDNNSLQMAQVNFGLNPPNPDCYCTGPLYFVTDQSQYGGAHWMPNGQVWGGEQIAKIIDKIMNGEGWQPNQIYNNTFRGSSILLSCLVPEPPLQNVPVYVGTTATSFSDWGFAVTDANGANPIVSVELPLLPDGVSTAQATIRIFTNRPLVAPVRVQYANRGTKNTSGYHQAAGNVFDSCPQRSYQVYRYTDFAGSLPGEDIPALIGQPYPLFNPLCVYNGISTPS